MNKRGGKRKNAGRKAKENLLKEVFPKLQTTEKEVKEFLKEHLFETNVPQLQKHILKNFYFKVNNTKFLDKKKLSTQIELAVKRLIKSHNIKSERFEFMFRINGDNFVREQCTLYILFDCLSKEKL